MLALLQQFADRLGQGLHAPNPASFLPPTTDRQMRLSDGSKLSVYVNMSVCL